MKTTDFFVDRFQNASNGKSGMLILSHARLNLRPLAFECLSFKHAIRFLRELGLAAEPNPLTFADLEKIKGVAIQGVGQDQVGDTVITAGVLLF
jgi:hypothetical protein